MFPEVLENIHHTVCVCHKCQNISITKVRESFTKEDGHPAWRWLNRHSSAHPA